MYRDGSTRDSVGVLVELLDLPGEVLGEVGEVPDLVAEDCAEHAPETLLGADPVLGLVVSPRPLLGQGRGADEETLDLSRVEGLPVV